MSLLVNIDVDDLSKAIAFYSAAFGLRVGRKFGGSGVEMLGSSSPIYLLLKETGSVAADTTAQRRDYARHWTPVHLDFAVDDIDTAMHAALAAGAQLEKPVSVRQWGKLALMSDPFGHGFCFIQFLGRGYDEICDR